MKIFSLKVYVIHFIYCENFRDKEAKYALYVTYFNIDFRIIVLHKNMTFSYLLNVVKVCSYSMSYLIIA